MIAAMDAIKDGTISINKAALLHRVPPTTLKDRLSGRVFHGTNSGPKRYLDEQEELALADHLVELARIGYGKMRQQVKSLVVKVFNRRFEEIYSDADYVSWLQLNHSTAVPHEYSDVPSILEGFSDITPIDPLQ